MIYLNYSVFLSKNYLLLVQFLTMVVLVIGGWTTSAVNNSVCSSIANDNNDYNGQNLNNLL